LRDFFFQFIFITAVSLHDLFFPSIFIPAVSLRLCAFAPLRETFFSIHIQYCSFFA